MKRSHHPTTLLRIISQQIYQHQTISALPRTDTHINIDSTLYNKQAKQHKFPDHNATKDHRISLAHITANEGVCRAKGYLMMSVFVLNIV